MLLTAVGTAGLELAILGWKRAKRRVPDFGAPICFRVKKVNRDEEKKRIEKLSFLQLRPIMIDKARGGNLMRKWAVPLTVLGVGGIGALMLSPRGRSAIRWVFRRMEEAPEHIAQWNETAQIELEK